MTKRKNNTPLLIRVVQWLFPKLEKVAPFLAHYIFKLAFYIPAKYPIPEKETEAASSAKTSVLEVDIHQIQMYSWGDEARPYVLLVHGWAGRATQFRKFITPLQDAGFCVLAFDAPAHGKSSGVRTSIIEFEKVLFEVFKHFGTPAAIITHSFGGAAVLYAASNGLPVQKLINIATPYVADEILKSYLVVLNGSWKSAEKFKAFVKRESGRPFEEFTGMHSIKHLTGKLKLMLVHDEDDTEMLVLHAEELKKVYPSAEFIKTRGLGHTRILKDPLVIDSCVKFVAQE